MSFVSATVVIEKDDPSGWHAYVLEWEGCHSFGDTPEEVRENLNEAIELYLETKKEHVNTTPKIIEKIYLDTMLFENPSFHKQYSKA